MVRTAIQLQTLEDLPDELPELIARVGDTTLEGVEFTGLAGSSPSVVADAVATAGVEMIGAHVSVDQLESEYDALVETYGELGCRRFIAQSYDEDAFDSLEATEAVADHLSDLASKLAADGFEFCYHNSTVEFDQLGDEYVYDVLLDRTDDSIAFELDTGLAVYAGADPISLLSRYGDRISLVHLTDSVPGREATIQVEVGAGELDVKRCVDAARDADVAWLVYEHGQTDDPLDSLSYASTLLPTLSSGHDPNATSSVY
ncbi:sugar phosphate isomerase/epimerase family protein [Natrononativus amylolyticus]|uniref:sugar phosphate isomerase/epimerase family protein n=1 Tax=Natrononativus amylolyticus TaxID=2963434 RepID=UPI0020CF65DB|nr:TIM barrel protein [Natrononativus amylolyticus]